jgi:S1-C subfamily serine protease
MMRFALNFSLSSLLAVLLAAFATSPAAAQQQRVVPESAPAMKQSFAPVVKRAAPAVINAYVSRK